MLTWWQTPVLGFIRRQIWVSYGGVENGGVETAGPLLIALLLLVQLRHCFDYPTL